MPKFVDISLVKENPDNPRSITDEQFEKLVESIKKFPEMLNIRPIVVNREMIVLGGNMRLRACIEAGLKQIPVEITHLSKTQEQEFIIRDNLNYGDWDLPKLRTDEWDISQLKEWGIDVGKLNETPDPVTRIFENSVSQLMICCKDERQQKQVFEELEKRGFKCKLLM